MCVNVCVGVCPFVSTSVSVCVDACVCVCVCTCVRKRVYMHVLGKRSGVALKAMCERGIRLDCECALSLPLS